MKKVRQRLFSFLVAVALWLEIHPAAHIGFERKNREKADQCLKSATLFGNPLTKETPPCLNLYFLFIVRTRVGQRSSKGD